MSAAFIVAAARKVDGAGSLAPVDKKWRELRECGAQLLELVIDPLDAGWSTPIAPHHFRSGCAPIEALARANRLICENSVDAVLIRGEDNLRSRYAEDKVLRQNLMSIYGAEYSVPQVYTLLARAFMRRHDLPGEDFKELSHALFENYQRTAQRNGSFHLPKPQAFAMATELFRFVDCANPVIDFSGAIVVTSAEFADEKSVKILATELAQTEGDGPEYAETIASYDHLQHACEQAFAQAEVDFAEEFREGRALLEAYTCFPVAPLGFLWASGIARGKSDVIDLLQKREITVTGGMNLARAPWNNPALNALIVMFQRLTHGDAPLGAVHGNGGLGYRQGVAVLEYAH